jgi:hypothetical protein
MANILQASLLTNFLYPLVLMFVLTFAILEKINIFRAAGDTTSKKSQLHAIIALAISLIFVSAVFPKIIVANLVQFLTVGLVIIFVALVLWGFVSGESTFTGNMRKFFAWIIGFAVFFAVLWATGVGGPIVDAIKKFFTFLFGSGWSSAFWTNAIFIALIGIVIAIVLKSSSSGGDKSNGGDKS